MSTLVGLLQWGGDTLSLQKEEEPSVGVTFDFFQNQFTSRKGRQRGPPEGEAGPIADAGL